MKVFTPLTVQNLTLKNRLVMAPMCMYMADEDGFVQPFHETHYATRAYGGIALIITEATAVEPKGRISKNDLGIWKDEHIEGLQKVVDKVHLAGAKIAIQLAHAGRKCGVTTEKAVSASPIAFSEHYQTPHELSVKEIQKIVLSFQEGAIRAHKAGFDMIEIHAAHGYLINQFLSPLTNRRTDSYGGSLENRVRFLREILLAIKQVWKKPLAIRFSANEYAEGGHDITRTKQVIERIKEYVDIIDVSSGGVVAVPVHPFPLYQIPLSKDIKTLDVMTIGGGLVTSLEQVEQILTNNDADLIYLGRELLRNPYFALMAAKEAAEEKFMLQAYKRGY